MKNMELLIGEMLQAGEKIKNLDLAGVHGNLMADTMGKAAGDDFWRKNYISLLEKVRDGSYPTTVDFKTVLQHTEGTDDLVDGIIVPSVEAKQGESGLRVAFSYSFAEDVAELYWTVTFPDLGVSSFGGMAPVCRNTEEIHWILGEEVRVTEGILHVTWRCLEGNVVKSQVQRISVNPVGSVQAGWSVTEPVKKTSRRDYILVVYGRQAAGAEQPDYEKPVKISPDNKYQELLLECKGEVAFDKAISNARLAGVVLNTDHGMAASSNSEVKYSDKKLEFHQPEDWNAKVPTKRLSLNDKASLLITMAVQFADGENVTLRLKSADGGWASQDEKSHAYKGSGNELNIHTLRMLWGCVAEDTLVTMADGKRQRISGLKQGDRIMAGDGSAAEISTVYSGPQKELYVLVLADGTRFRASDTHPVKTEAGFVPISCIEAGDWVQMQDGSMQQAVSLDTEEYSGKAYNLQLCGGKRNMYCNGILAGDFITENERGAAGETEGGPENAAERKPGDSAGKDGKQDG